MIALFYLEIWHQLKRPTFQFPQQQRTKLYRLFGKYHSTTKCRHPDLAPIAKEVASELGIDRRIVMAQAVLETGWGSKVRGNNYFGIKGKGQAFTTHEEVDGLMVKQKDEFRTYYSLEDSVRDYGKFLKENKRYKPLLEADSFDEQIEALAGSGYATDSRYGEKILRIIEGKTFRNLVG